MSINVVGVLLAALVLVCSGCATKTRINYGFNSKDLPAYVRVGEKVELSTVNGKKYKFVVTSVGSEYIAGKRVKVKNSDITKLEKIKRKGFFTSILRLMSNYAVNTAL